jgi:peptidoglycan/xylan/chitin deacetylase (PgdA/CDA1 family)
MDANRYATSWKEAAPKPAGMRSKARNLLRRLTLSTLAFLSRRSPGNAFLRCLYCHYVFDDQRGRFENLLVELKSLGTFVDTDTCLQMLEGRKTIDRTYFHLSIDDGFRNAFTNAYPILVRHKVPAIFFVPSSLVGAGWEEAKVYCLKTMEYNAVIELIKWDDLAQMLSSGYEVGSHTRTHARFSEISSAPTLLEEEILGSRNEIERQLGIQCQYISWPYGELKDADATSLAMTEKAGYKACFGAYRGSVRAKTTNPYSIPRHHFEVEWPLSDIRYFAKGNMEASL